MFLLGSVAPQSCWAVIGIGIRLAQAVGVHRKRVYGKTPTVGNELWKRAFWWGVTFDSVQIWRLTCPTGYLLRWIGSVVLASDGRAQCRMKSEFSSASCRDSHDITSMLASTSNSQQNVMTNIGPLQKPAKPSCNLLRSHQKCLFSFHT